MLTKLGFDQEGIQKEMAFLNGIYHDKFLFGMTEDQFRRVYGNKYAI